MAATNIITLANGQKVSVATNATGQLEATNGMTPAQVAASGVNQVVNTQSTGYGPNYGYTGGGSSAPAPVVVPPTYAQPTPPATTLQGLTTPAQISAFQTANKLPVTGTMNPATSAAYVKQSPGYVATPSGSAFGSSSGSVMGSTSAGASASAANSLTALYDTKTGFLTPAGVAAGAPAVNAGDPSAKPTTSNIPTVDANGNVTLPNGQVINSQGQTIKSATATPPNTPTITASVTDSNGNVTNTYSDGTSQVAPVSPTLAPLYGQANVATQQQTNSYNDSVTAENTAYQQQLQQLQEQMANAQQGAEASYDTDNPEGSGSDKAQYASSVTKPFLEAINNLEANHSNTLTQLSDSNTAALQNIQEQLQTGIQTNNANIYNSGLNTLQSLEKGTGEPLSDFDNATLIQQLTTGGSMTVQQAQLEIDSALLEAKNSQDKTLTTEQRQEQAQYIGLWKNDLSTMTDPTKSSTDPTTINDGLRAGVAGNPAGFDSDGNPLYTDDQRNQVTQKILNSGFKQQTQAQNIKFKDASLNERYAALAQSKSLSDAQKDQAMFNSSDSSQWSLADQTALATQWATDTGFDEKQLLTMIQAGPNKLEPTTTTTGGSVNILGVKSGTTSTKTKGGDNSSSSASTGTSSTTNPLGI